MDAGNFATKKKPMLVIPTWANYVMLVCFDYIMLFCYCRGIGQSLGYAPKHSVPIPYNGIFFVLDSTAC